MPSLETAGLFSVAAVALLLIPGPAVSYIVTRSIDQGRAAGLVSVAGIHVGTSVHIIAATLGLSGLLLSSAVAFEAVKYLGAGYLIVVGVRTLLSRSADGAIPMRPRRHFRRIFADAVVVNALNPKTALFFLAFLPQFVDPARGAITLQILALGALFVALGLLTDTGYALSASAAAYRLRTSSLFERMRTRLAGVVYIVLGASAAFTVRSEG
ncbi:MAG: LysE family translocator [Chloroflexi bacterium]|nr:LysE family translocator [Chloroflexota bacterium]